MRAPALLLLPLLAATACGGSSGAPTGAASTAIAVSSSDTACDVAKTDLNAGKVSFAVRNTGSDVTEVYVYAKGSDGTFTKVVGEVENIAPGTSRAFPVTLTGGTYEVACKPGQQGDGIRTTLTVSGATGSPAEAAYDREVEVSAAEYSFTGLAGFTGRVGERVEFKLQNTGTTQHELEVLDPSGTNIGEVGPTEPGKAGEVVITFPTAGTYTFLCGIGDHAERGLKGTFVVS